MLFLLLVTMYVHSSCASRTDVKYVTSLLRMVIMYKWLVRFLVNELVRRVFPCANGLLVIIQCFQLSGIL